MRKMMTFSFESELRRILDKPSISMFELWHSLCYEIIGQTIEIIATNINQLIEYDSIRGQVNTAKLSKLPNGKTVLCVFLHDFPKINPIYLTHEIGHYVLHLKGFKQVGYTSDPMCQEQIQINSLCDHPVLYDLQRQLGHEPQNMIDSRAEKHFWLVYKNVKHKEKDVLNYSLTIADDVINSSSKISKKIKRNAKRFQPKINNILEDTLSSVNQYDLFNVNENFECRCSIIKKLGLGNKLIIKDDIKKLKNYVNMKLVLNEDACS